MKLYAIFFIVPLSAFTLFSMDYNAMQKLASSVKSKDCGIKALNVHKPPYKRRKIAKIIFKTEPNASTTHFLNLPDYVLGLIATQVSLADGGHMRQTCSYLCHRFWAQRMIIISRHGFKDEYHDNHSFWNHLRTSIDNVQRLIQLCHGSNPIWLRINGIQFFKTKHNQASSCFSIAHNVKILSIDNSNLPGIALQQIANMPQLIDLRISNIQRILHNHMFFLKGLKNLKNLTLNGNKIVLLPNLGHLTHLERCSLGYNDLITFSLKALYNCKKLKLLDIRGNELLDQSSIKELEHQLPNTLIISDSNAGKLDVKLRNSLEKRTPSDFQESSESYLNK